MNRRLIRPKFVGQTVEFAKAPLLDKLHRTDSFMHLRLRHVQRLLLPPSLRRVLALACLYALQIVLYLRQLLLGIMVTQLDREPAVRMLAAEVLLGEPGRACTPALPLRSALPVLCCVALEAWSSSGGSQLISSPCQGLPID